MKIINASLYGKLGDKITLKANQRKMSEEELQSYLKAKRQGNGYHKNKKAYDRKQRIS